MDDSRIDVLHILSRCPEPREVARIFDLRIDYAVFLDFTDWDRALALAATFAQDYPLVRTIAVGACKMPGHRWLLAQLGVHDILPIPIPEQPAPLRLDELLDNEFLHDDVPDAIDYDYQQQLAAVELGDYKAPNRWTWSLGTLTTWFAWT